MKNPIGINTWVWTSPFNSREAGLIGKAARMGFDVLEIAVEDPAHYRNKWVDDALRRTGITPVVCGAFGPSRDLTHDSAQFRRESLEYIHGVLELCERWGVRTFVGPMYSAVGKRRQVSAAQKQREWARAVAGLGEASYMARQHGVTLAIEPLNRFETDLVNTCAQALQLVKDVGEDNVKIHLDTFHMTIEETSIYDAITLAGPQLAHFHACENNRGTPGTGLVAWDQVASGLKAAEYNGPLVIESFTPKCQAIAAAAAIWRPLARSQDRLARDGLKFLRDL